jgi:hypothetical protein
MTDVCEWTDEQCDDNVLGSGALRWEWYADGGITPAGVYEIEMWNGVEPKESADWRVFKFTHDKVRQVVTELLLGNHSVRGDLVTQLRGPADEISPDADIMDCVIQIIAYGKVLFS